MSMLEPGQSFGHYTIVSQSATDEAGTLYRAYDSGAASDVLLRVLPASQAAGMEARIQALGSALRKLSHPNILRVLETGVADGAAYVAMPIVEAAPLAERIAGGQITPAQSDKLIGQIASALQYAHDNGVVHGALSPAHVLVDSSGNALVTDFGLAALEGGLSAPDARADVTALGGVLLSLLTGKATAPDRSTLDAALGGLTASLPADRRDAVASAYARAVSKLTGTPGAAYDSARAFLADWQEAGKAAAAGGAAPAPTTTLPTAPPPFAGMKAPVPPVIAPQVAPIPPPPQPAASTPPPMTGTAVSTAAQDLAKARARAQQIMEEAQAKNKAAAEAARAQADATVQKAKGDAEFAQAQARDAAARAPGAGPAARDTLRSALEISQRIARGTSDPARRLALEKVIADIRAIGEQRAAGQMTDEAAHAAITDLVRQVRALEGEALPAARDAAKVASLAALGEAQRAAPAVGRAVQQEAATAARPVVNRARPVLAGGVVIILVVCVALTVLCVAIGSILPDATPTPGAVATESATRRPATATARPAAVVNTPGVGVPIIGATPRATAAPLRALAVFTDTFAAGNCNLPEGDDTRRTLKCDANQYVMLVKPSVARWAYYDAPEYQNIVIDYDARAIASAPGMEYGVIWDVASDGQSFYGFTLRPNGEAAIFVYKDSDFSYFVEGLTIQNFRTGGNLNHVTITANGPDLAFAVNGEPLAITLSDTSLTSGTVGFIVNSDAPNAKAAFSNLVISQIQ